MADSITAPSATTKPATKKVTKKAAPSKVSSHPTYFQMIKDAILALKERTGSSPQAIAKYMEEHHKADLPGNFKKILGTQLKNSVAKGKLIKIKASFKLSDAAKKEKAPKPAAGKKPKAPKATKATEKKSKATKATGKKAKKAGASKKKKSTTAKPVKKAAVKKAPAKKSVKSTPVKRKVPKSIKSPAAKKAKKA